MMSVSSSLQSLGQELEVDVQRVYMDAEKDLRTRDYDRFSRTLQGAHEYIYCHHSKNNLGSTSSIKARKDTLVDGLWTVAIIHAAHERIYNGVPQEASALPPTSTASLTVEERVPLRDVPKGIDALTAEEILPGGYHIPRVLERCLLDAMRDMHIRLATGNSSKPYIDLNNREDRKLFDKMRQGLSPHIAEEAAEASAKDKGSQVLFVDIRPLYQGIEPSRPSVFNAGLSAADLATRKAYINTMIVR